MRLKYDVVEWKCLSDYDPTRYAEKFLTMIQLEYVYENAGNSCCTSGKCIFDTNMSN